MLLVVGKAALAFGLPLVPFALAWGWVPDGPGRPTPVNGAAVSTGMTAAQVNGLLGPGGCDVSERLIPAERRGSGLRWRCWDSEPGGGKYSAVVGFSADGLVVAEYDEFR